MPVDECAVLQTPRHSLQQVPSLQSQHQAYHASAYVEHGVALDRVELQSALQWSASNPGPSRETSKSRSSAAWGIFNYCKGASISGHGAEGRLGIPQIGVGAASMLVGEQAGVFQMPSDGEVCR